MVDRPQPCCFLSCVCCLYLYKSVCIKATTNKSTKRKASPNEIQVANKTRYPASMSFTIQNRHAAKDLFGFVYCLEDHVCLGHGVRSMMGQAVSEVVEVVSRFHWEKLSR